MGFLRRKPAPGLIHHSDRGSQYASHDFQARLKEYGMTCSMSRKGNCWDNAPTESFFNSLKNERVHGTRYSTRAEAVADLFDYIDLPGDVRTEGRHRNVQDIVVSIFHLEFDIIQKLKDLYCC